MLKKYSLRNEGIDVQNEKEFKLWVKFIASIKKEGGDINKPLEILWKSVNYQFELLKHKNNDTKKLTY